MSIQKQKLVKIAQGLSKQIDILFQLSDQKRAFAKRINYQIASLFSLLSNFPTISSRELTNIFEPASIRLLIQNKKYFTLQNLCEYLGVSDKYANITFSGKNNKEMHHNDIQLRYELEDLIEKQVDCMEKIRAYLKVQPYQAIFGDIDFFNNGYVDANSFFQFIQHYWPSKDIEYTISSQKKDVRFYQQEKTSQITNLNYKQLICIEIIKYLKCSATAEKIFYVDFVSILQQINPNLNPQLVPTLPTLPTHSLSLSRSIGHIARVSDLQVIHSRQKKSKNPLNHSSHYQQSIQQSHLRNYTLSNGYQIYRSTNKNDKIELMDAEISSIKQKQKTNSEQIEQRVHKFIDMADKLGGYEQKICSNHRRNLKYIQRLKIQTNMSNFGQNKQFIRQKKTDEKYNQIYKMKAVQKYAKSFNPLRQNPEIKKKISSSQILYQFRYIAQIYDKHRREVQNLVNNNQNFTIINGFNVIDVQDRGYVTLKQLKQFLYEIDAIVNDNKVQVFFDILAHNKSIQVEVAKGKQQTKIITYPNFASKIFKLKSIQNIYKNTRKRKPLICQSWPQLQQKNYCRFIRCIILIFNELDTAKNMLKKMFFSFQDKEQQSSQKQNEKIQEIRSIMEQIFEDSDIHHDKFKEMLGKNCETFIAELYGQQVILEPKTLLTFLQLII